MSESFTFHDFHGICDILAARDKDLQSIIHMYGYPPMWTRPNTFASLVHIILEQQVSLASALAALSKLREKVGRVTPGRVLRLTDEELKACYFSRQKTAYVRNLAHALREGAINLKALEKLPDEQVRTTLCRLKGIGNWTADIYLIFVLHRADVFPHGDLAAVNALKQVRGFSADDIPHRLRAAVLDWQPYRTVATMLLWHYYLSSRKGKQA